MKLFKHVLWFTIVFVAIVSCNKKLDTTVFTDAVNAIDQVDFQQTIDGKKVDLYTLVGENRIGMKVTNFGARIVALCVPDQNEKPVDVVFGYNKLDDYLNNPEYFFGAAIGRYGNRICEGKFSIDSVSYQLNQNNGKNALHGGPKGYYNVVWDAKKVSDTKIEFTHLSADGEEGYPGNLNVTMTYELTAENGLLITYSATTDKATVCNLTHHSYFNLSGEGAETINDHILMINADNTTPVDSTLIPTGEIAYVSGTPFDFTAPMAIGSRVNDVDTQLMYGMGYDHNWVLNREGEGVQLAASLYSPITKIKMEVLTDQPGLQFYGGNFLDGVVSGKLGIPYTFRSGLCLETQHFPDSPNQPQFPGATLLPGETYSHICEYRFSIEK